MKERYNGVQFYGVNDYSLEGNFQLAHSIIDSFNEKNEYVDINKIIELYNVYLFFTCDSIKPELTNPYIQKTKNIMKVLSKFFNTMNDDSFLDYYHKVCRNYYDNFWTLFENFNIFKKISDETFNTILCDSETNLHEILKHNKIVYHFDTIIADYMRNSDQSARIIMGQFLEKRNGSIKLFLPKSLKPTEYELILQKYIDSGNPNINYLDLIASSLSSGECPLSDKLRLNAKKKSNELKQKLSPNGLHLDYGFSFKFKEMDEPIIIDSEDRRIINYTYVIKWIKDNLDYPTLLNNLIYLFDFVDKCYRCSFTNIKSEISIFEAVLGVKGIKEYPLSAIFNHKQVLSNAQIRMYSMILSNYGIKIENVFQWFFSDYIKSEFGVNGFIINIPSSDSLMREKCKDIVSEIDGILKQYQMYIEDHEINRELYEMSSKHMFVKDLGSLLSNKYAYINSKEINNELFFLFSDQSVLCYTEKHGDGYDSFFELISNVEVNLSDYHEFQIKNIKWLEERTTITIDQNGIIKPNIVRCIVLKDLYKHEVVRPYYYRNKTEIEKMALSGDLRYESSLFSIPEQNYLNYILNKSEYSNGKDLRNKYSHSTYPLDEKQQEYDYYEFLKILAIIIMKINEEFDIYDTINKDKEGD